jgi:hypothetical protein
MTSESEFQSDFESVILYFANKIVTYIVGSRIPTINVIILTCFLIPCRRKEKNQRKIGTVSKSSGILTKSLTQ